MNSKKKETENATWNTTTGIERTDRYPKNDIFCMGCRDKLGCVLEYRYIQLDGWDRKVVFDTFKGTATVKCKCGTGRVIRGIGHDEEHDKEMLDVWLQEITNGNGGEHENSSEGTCDSYGADGETESLPEAVGSEREETQ